MMAKRRFRFSERLPGHSSGGYYYYYYYYYDPTTLYKASIDRNDPVSGNVSLAMILCVMCPQSSCLPGRSAQNDQKYRPKGSIVWRRFGHFVWDAKFDVSKNEF
jgi:hypothetical protein